MRALMLEKNGEGVFRASVQDIDAAGLPDGDVEVAIEYSTLNYKDGLAITQKTMIALGGSIAVRNTETGAEFTLVFQALKELG